MYIDCYNICKVDETTFKVTLNIKVTHFIMKTRPDKENQPHSKIQKR